MSLSILNTEIPRGQVAASGQGDMEYRLNETAHSLADPQTLSPNVNLILDGCHHYGLKFWQCHVPESLFFLETLASGELEGLMAYSQSTEAFILIY